MNKQCPICTHNFRPDDIVMPIQFVVAAPTADDPEALHPESLYAHLRCVSIGVLYYEKLAESASLGRMFQAGLRETGKGHVAAPEVEDEKRKADY